jgi:pseudaminic acid cytidylyltransferase
MRLAVIPARGGSQRIPKKNVKLFCGKPMIAWSIETALASGCFDRVVVSTDSEEIGEVARHAGAEVPFRRPADLADEYTGTIPVVAHAVRWMEQYSTLPSLVCCIYATAPFLRVEDLRAGAEALRACEIDYAFAVTSYAYPIQRALRIDDCGRTAMLNPELFNTRSQDLEPVFHDAGQFYWGRAKVWLESRPIFSSSSVPIVLPRVRVQDIDHPEDWRQAELMFRLLHPGMALHE